MEVLILRMREVVHAKLIIRFVIGYMTASEKCLKTVAAGTRC